jgi:hypothetical protein
MYPGSPSPVQRRELAVEKRGQHKIAADPGTDAGGLIRPQPSRGAPRSESATERPVRVIRRRSFVAVFPSASSHGGRGRSGVDRVWLRLAGARGPHSGI